MADLHHYPWLKELYRQLIEPHQRQRAHHAQLLLTSPGCAAECLVDQLASWILCQQPQDKLPCDRCHACALMASQNHPDYHRCSLASDKQQLGIEQIRGLLPLVYQHAQQGGAKVIGLLSCERLSESAVNALLKIIEEPPPNTYFLLICHQQQNIPITLRSRCQSWLVRPPSAVMAISWLQQQLPQLTLSDAELAWQLSNGAPLLAKQLLMNAGISEYVVWLEALQSALQQRHFPSLLPQLDQSSAARQLSWLAMFWLEAAKQQQSVCTNSFSTQQQAVITLLSSRGLSLSQLLAGCRQFLQCRYQLLTMPSLNQTLLLAELLHQYQSICFDHSLH